MSSSGLAPAPDEEVHWAVEHITEDLDQEIHPLARRIQLQATCMHMTDKVLFS